MTFAFPWALLGLLAVAAAALLTLLRPARRRVVVPSLAPWSAAVARNATAVRQRSRRAVLSWLLLLLGATAAVLALARPTVHSRTYERRLAIGIVNTAELRHLASIEVPAFSADMLLGGLLLSDRIQLLLPEHAGGASDWLYDSEVRRRFRELELLPMLAGEAILSEPSDQADHVLVFAPAGMDAGAFSADWQIIEMPTCVGAVSVESAAAEVVSPQRAQLFVALSNNTDRTQRLKLTVTTFDGEGRRMSSVSRRLDIEARKRKSTVLNIPADAGIAVTTDADAGAWWGGRAYLARRPHGRIAVATVGRDEPALRRVIEAADWLELVAEPRDADVVIANGVEPPQGAAALVIAPPSAPPGCESAPSRERVRLDDANVAADDPIMRHVDLRGAAVRRLQPWSGFGRRYVPLASMDGEAIILRDAPGPLPHPRRVYVGFSLDVENTNFTLSEAFVLFAAATMEYLAGESADGGTYVSLTPLEAGPGPARRAIVAGGEHPSMLPLPGLYADADGTLQAVSLTGMRRVDVDLEPGLQAMGLFTRWATPTDHARELWPLPAVLALALWLGGWVLRGDPL